MNKYALVIGIISAMCVINNSVGALPGDSTIQCPLTQELCASMIICEPISGTNYEGCGPGILSKQPCKCVVFLYNSYRCADGYYGTPTSGTNKPTCTPCPALDDGTVGTSIAGENATSDKCYIPKNTTHSDDTGMYNLTDNCYY